jgi:hypothetical protein
METNNNDELIVIDCLKLNKHLSHVSNSCLNLNTSSSLFNEKDRKFQIVIDQLG